MHASMIVLTGVDGSGKSTLVSNLAQRMGARGISTQIVWLRMNYLLTRPVLLFCRLIGLTKRPTINGLTISIHEFYRAPVIAKLVQYLHWIDTLLHWAVKVWAPMYFRHRTIICDRFVHDILIDFAIEAREWNIFNKLTARLFYQLIPKNAVMFFIDTPKELILKRKPEVADFDPDFEKRYAIFQKLKNSRRFYVIDNSAGLEKSLAEIEHHIYKVTCYD